MVLGKSLMVYSSSSSSHSMVIIIITILGTMGKLVVGMRTEVVRRIFRIGTTRDNWARISNCYLWRVGGLDFLFELFCKLPLGLGRELNGL
jgi:hypothetical protein